MTHDRSELLVRYAGTLTELRNRGALRSANAPAVDYADLLFHRAPDGELADPSVKSYNLTMRDERRVQVKFDPRVSDPSMRGQLQTSAAPGNSPWPGWSCCTAELANEVLTGMQKA